MTILVHGLGHIGLSTAALFANNGHEVVGYDTDRELRDRLRRGTPDLAEVELDEYVRRALDDGLSVTSEVVAADVHLICVPTPLDDEGDHADLRYVRQVADAIAEVLGPGDLVVLESTVPPGTTQSTLVPVVEETGLTVGTDVQVAYSPETVMPGNTVTELLTNDRIVGGVTPAAGEAVRDLYQPVIDGDVDLTPDATTAEFVKLVQNAYRDVNIAFANELALVGRDHAVETRGAIELANRHPRVDILDPGPGVGGHCLPVDPVFLSAGSDATALISCARTVNDGMPAHVVERLRSELGQLSDATICVLGVAYKGNVDDTRNSPGLAIARELTAAPVQEAAVADGGRDTMPNVRLADPHVRDPRLDLLPIARALEGADAAVVAAAHDEFAALEPERVAGLLADRVVLDAVGVLDRARWTDCGFRVLDL